MHLRLKSTIIFIKLVHVQMILYLENSNRASHMTEWSFLHSYSLLEKMVDKWMDGE